MKAILDSCVAAKWVLVETESPAAMRLRSEFQNGRHEFLAPSVFPAECGHLLLRAERKKLIKPGEAEILFADIFSTSPAIHDYVALSERAIEIGSDFRCGFYDCTYVALAEQENCELITSDQKLIANLRKHFPFIVPLSSLP